MNVLAAFVRIPKAFLSSRSVSVVKFCSLSKMPFYAVAKGVEPGIYTEWKECEKQVKGFKGPQFKKFNTREEAEEFIQQKSGGIVDKRKKTEAVDSKKEGVKEILKEFKDAQKELSVMRDQFDVYSATHQLNKASNSSVSSRILNNSLPSNLPPELQEIKIQFRIIQKNLTQLRKKFDLYVASHPSSSDDAPSESKGKKRPHSDDEEDQEYTSAIKKRVYERTVPDKDKFELDSDGNVVVYTDGCSQFNGKQGAKAGIGVFFGDDNPLNVSEPVEGRATNNTAEIQAITYALELIKRAGFTGAVINTDSQFVINCMTSWMSGWKKRGWKKSDGSPVINKDDLIDCDKASNGLRVKYNHVKGHSGVHGNEMADKLAKAGSKRYTAPEDDQS